MQLACDGPEAGEGMDANPDITILLPTRNEAECIGKILAATAAELERHRLSYEILVLDDESEDGTQKIAQSAASKNAKIALVRRQPPHAFGYAIRDGIRRARGRLTVVMMADLSDDPAFIAPMWKKFNEGYQVIVGSRFVPGARIRDYSALKMVANRLFNLAVKFCLLAPTNDMSNNFKAFDTSLAKRLPLTSKGFEVGAEIAIRMHLEGARLAEMPVCWSDRSAGKAKFRLSHSFLNYFLLFVKMVGAAYLEGAIIRVLVKK